VKGTLVVGSLVGRVPPGTAPVPARVVCRVGACAWIGTAMFATLGANDVSSACTRAARASAAFGTASYAPPVSSVFRTGLPAVGDALLLLTGTP